jgi:hypothetical protein
VALLLMPFVLSLLQQIERNLDDWSAPPPASSPATSPAHVWKQSKKPIKLSSSPRRAVSRRSLAVAQKSPERHRSTPPARLAGEPRRKPN